MPTTPTNLPGKVWKWKKWKKPDVQTLTIWEHLSRKQPLLMIFEQKSHVLSEPTLKVEYHTYPTCSPKIRELVWYVGRSIPVSECHGRKWIFWNLMGLDWLVVEPTHLKNMLVKLDHFPKDRGENSKNIWNQPPRGNSPGTFVEVMDIISLTTQLNFCLESRDFTSLSWKKPGGRYPQSFAPQKKHLHSWWLQPITTLGHTHFHHQTRSLRIWSRS